MTDKQLITISPDVILGSGIGTMKYLVLTLRTHARKCPHTTCDLGKLADHIEEQMRPPEPPLSSVVTDKHGVTWVHWATNTSDAGNWIKAGSTGGFTYTRWQDIEVGS